MDNNYSHEETILSDVGKGEKLRLGRLFIWFFLCVLIFSLYLFYQVIQPFFHSIIIACIFSAICHPAYLRCLKWTKEREAVAALIVLLGLTVLVAIPVTFFCVELVPQARSTITAVNSWLAGHQIVDVISQHVNPFITWINEYFPEVELNIVDMREGIVSLSKALGQFVFSGTTILFGNILRISVHFLLVLGIMFYLLINGGQVLDRAMYLLPLKPNQTTVVIDRMRSISRSVFVGGLLVASLQGIVGGIGFAIVGIPALFWGTLMAFAALVPVLGTGLVWAPAVLFLYFTGASGKALFLLIWSVGIVCSIDTFLRPYLLRDSVRVPVLFLFLSILGGVNAFGMLGMLYGPMILGLTAIMLSLYGEEFSSVLDNREQPTIESK